MDNINLDLGEIGWGGMDSIDLIQNRDQWRVLVNTVMLRSFCVAAQLAACQESLSSKELVS
jgi:hypothetical protein